MRTIDVSEVTALVRKLCIDANYYLPADLRRPSWTVSRASSLRSAARSSER